MKAALPALVSILALAACVPATKPAPPGVTPPVTRMPPARPAPAPVLQAPVSSDWIDAALTPGSWNYEDRENLTLAVFVTPGRGSTFAIHCWRPSGNLELMMSGQGRPNPAMTIRTETVSRAIGAELVIDEFARVIATVPGNDPLLDAMALSKGRFAIESEGLATLILPSHAEVSRVIEDCR